MSGKTLKTMAAAGLTAASFVAISNGVASAQGVALTGSISQSFQIRDNFNLADIGTDLDSVTTLSTQISSETERYQLSLGSNVAIRANPALDASVTQPSFRLNFATTQNRSVNFNLNASYIERDVSFDEVQPDLTTLTLSGERRRVNAGIGTSIPLLRETNLNLGANVAFTDFSEDSPSLIGSTTTGLNAGLNHQFTNRTSGGINSSVRFFDPDAGGTESTTTNVNVNVNHALSSTSSANGSIGLSFTDDETDTGNTNITFNAGYNEQLAIGNFSASATQNVVPSATGDLNLNTVFRASFDRQVNVRQNFGLNGAISLQNVLGGGNSSTFFSFTPRYSYSLLDDLSANAAYTVRFDDDGDLSQNFSLTLTKSFDFPF